MLSNFQFYLRLLVVVLICFSSASADEGNSTSENSSLQHRGFSFGFFPGYQWPGGSRPFPLDYLDGTIRTGLAARYHLGNRTSLQLSTFIAKTSGEAQQLGVFVDELGRLVSVAIDLPEFSTQVITVSANHDWLIGSDAKRNERLTLSLGFGVHRVSGKARYLFSYGTILEQRLLSYPAETDPLSFLGLAYSRVLSGSARIQIGTELDAVLSTDPGFDEFEEFQTRGRFLLLFPSIHAGIWFMVGKG